MSYLDAAQLAGLRAGYAGLIQDAQVGGVSATFYARRTDGADVDFSTGQITEDATPETITVLMRPITNEVAENGQVGDAMILVDQAQLSATPDVSDAIEISGTRYQVIDAKEDITRSLWRLMVIEERAA